MEKSESSDSDSNSSASWVFVEPIQELTEHDLVSAGSDFESDTDGVSVISESEGVHEEFNENTCDETSDLQNAKVDFCETLTGRRSEMFDKPLVNESKKLFKNTNLVGVGVVLTAVFLGSYTFIVHRNSVKNTGDLQDFIVYDDKIDSNFLCKPDIGIDNQLEEIVDLTIACTYKDQEKSVVKSNEIKQCVKVQYDTKKSEKEIQTLDLLGMAEEQPQMINGKIIEEQADETSRNTVKIEYSPQDNEKQQLLYVYKATEEDKEQLNVNLNLVPKNNKTNKYTKEKNTEKVSKNKYKDDKKSFDNKKHRHKFEKSPHQYEIHTKNPKKVYKNKFENPKRSYEVKFKHNNRFVNVKKNSTSHDIKEVDKSGEWYSNWHKARQQLRKHDWIDAHYPYKKKTKMQWYFKWMDGREELRYKKSYRPYSS